MAAFVLKKIPVILLRHQVENVFLQSWRSYWKQAWITAFKAAVHTISVLWGGHLQGGALEERIPPGEQPLQAVVQILAQEGHRCRSCLLSQLSHQLESCCAAEGVLALPQLLGQGLQQPCHSKDTGKGLGFVLGLPKVVVTMGSCSRKLGTGLGIHIEVSEL